MAMELEQKTEEEVLLQHIMPTTITRQFAKQYINKLTLEEKCVLNEMLKVLEQKR